MCYIFKGCIIQFTTRLSKELRYWNIAHYLTCCQIKGNIAVVEFGVEGSIWKFAEVKKYVKEDSTLKLVYNTWIKANTQRVFNQVLLRYNSSVSGKSKTRLWNVPNSEILWVDMVSIYLRGIGGGYEMGLFSLVLIETDIMTGLCTSSMLEKM